MLGSRVLLSRNFMLPTFAFQCSPTCLDCMGLLLPKAGKMEGFSTLTQNPFPSLCLPKAVPLRLEENHLRKAEETLPRVCSLLCYSSLSHPGAPVSRKADVQP